MRYDDRKPNETNDMAHADNALSVHLVEDSLEEAVEEQEEETIENEVISEGGIATAVEYSPEETVEEQEIGAEEAFDNGATSDGDIVLVKKKTLHWPGKVLKVSTKCVRVMFYDKSRTIEDKKHAHIIPFSTDISMCEGRGSVWVKAWKEAKGEMEKMK